MVVLATQCGFTFCAHVIQTHTHEYDFRYIHFYLEFDEKCLSEDVMSVTKLLGRFIQGEGKNVKNENMSAYDSTNTIDELKQRNEFR